MDHPIISADSHVIEPPNCFRDHMDPKWRDRAPTIVDENGVSAVIEGFPKVKISNHFGPGADPQARERFTGFADLTRSGWDPKARRADQIRDGISAEVLYPSLGMLIANVSDYDYMQACFTGYNRWLAEYCAYDPVRLMGFGMTAMRSAEEAIADLHAIKALGLRGVSLPGIPGAEEYDHPMWDEFWRTAVGLKISVVFHVVAVGGGKHGITDPGRGSRLSAAMRTFRGLQDLLAVFVFGGVFDRVPELKLVFAEGDAGWLPHFAQRMDHSYLEHRHKFGQHDLHRMPSEYLMENFYFTFQDDRTAWMFADHMNWRRLMWANDFPHADATWPRSQQLLADHAALVTPEQRKAILCDNAAEAFYIDLASLERAEAA